MNINVRDLNERVIKEQLSRTRNFSFQKFLDSSSAIETFGVIKAKVENARPHRAQ